MMWSWSLISNYAFIPIWKCTTHSEQLLTLISVDYFTVEVRVLAGYLCYDLKINLGLDVLDRVLRQVLCHIH
jgi:hypothetical protein